ncbi:MAG: tetratricopeptide repeat protein [Candidatus Omnitrophica bacterium]|nr:tetratricopeptide repeat protein [Candidatus Omnitrophota bacterium]
MKLNKNVLLSFFLIGIIILKGTCAFALDEVILKSGKVIKGEILGADDKEVLIQSPDKKVTFTIVYTDIKKVNSPKPQLLLLADSDFFMGNYEQAYKKYLEVMGKYGPLSWGARAHLKAANCLIELGQVEKAVRMQEEFIKKYPSAGNVSNFKLNLANIFFKDGRRDKAIKIYEDLAASGGDDLLGEINFKLGEIYFGEGEFEKSLISYLRVVVLYHQVKWARKAKFKSGLCYEKLGDNLRALKTYEEFIKEFPQGDFSAESKEKINSLKKRRKGNVEKDKQE